MVHGVPVCSSNPLLPSSVLSQVTSPPIPPQVPQLHLAFATLMLRTMIKRQPVKRHVRHQQNDKDDSNNHGADNITNHYMISSVKSASNASNTTTYLSKIQVDSTIGQLQYGAALVMAFKQGLDARVDELYADKFILVAWSSLRLNRLSSP